MDNDEERFAEVCEKHAYQRLNDAFIYVPKEMKGYLVRGDDMRKHSFRENERHLDAFLIDESVCVPEGLEVDLVESDYSSLVPRDSEDLGSSFFSYLLNREISMVDNILLSKISIPRSPWGDSFRGTYDTSCNISSKFDGKNVLRYFNIGIEKDLSPLSRCEKSNYNPESRKVMSLY